MKILKAYPPNFGSIQSLAPSKDMIFCYGDTVYNPSGADIPEDVMLHEQVHSVQQKKFPHPEQWWQRYLSDPTFRQDQEIQAFAVQYASIRRNLDKTNMKNRHIITSDCLFDLANTLREKYKLVITQGEAESKIRNGAKDMV